MADNMKFPPSELPRMSSEYSIFHDQYTVDGLKDLLLKNPTIINERDDKSGWSLLFNSVISEDIDCTEYLLKAGADPNLGNIYGETPLYQAVDTGNSRIINLLLEQGADPNIQQQDGDTPLHIAAIKGDHKVVRLLLLYKADPTIATFQDKQTALDYARQQNQIKAMEILTEKLEEMGCFQIFTNEGAPDFTLQSKENFNEMQKIHTPDRPIIESNQNKPLKHSEFSLKRNNSEEKKSNLSFNDKSPTQLDKSLIEQTDLNKSAIDGVSERRSDNSFIEQMNMFEDKLSKIKKAIDEQGSVSNYKNKHSIGKSISGMQLGTVIIPTKTDYNLDDVSTKKKVQYDGISTSPNKVKIFDREIQKFDANTDVKRRANNMSVLQEPSHDTSLLSTKNLLDNNMSYCQERRKLDFSGIESDHRERTEVGDVYDRKRNIETGRNRENAYIKPNNLEAYDQETDNFNKDRFKTLENKKVERIGGNISNEPSTINQSINYQSNRINTSHNYPNRSNINDSINQGNSNRGPYMNSQSIGYNHINYNDYGRQNVHTNPNTEGNYSQYAQYYNQNSQRGNTNVQISSMNNNQQYTDYYYKKNIGMRDTNYNYDNNQSYAENINTNPYGNVNQSMHNPYISSQQRNLMNNDSMYYSNRNTTRYNEIDPNMYGNQNNISNYYNQYNTQHDKNQSYNLNNQMYNNYNTPGNALMQQNTSIGNRNNHGNVTQQVPYTLPNQPGIHPNKMQKRNLRSNIYNNVNNSVVSNVGSRVNIMGDDVSRISRDCTIQDSMDYGPLNTNPNYMRNPEFFLTENETSIVMEINLNKPKTRGYLKNRKDPREEFQDESEILAYFVSEPNDFSYNLEEGGLSKKLSKNQDIYYEIVEENEVSNANTKVNFSQTHQSLKNELGRIETKEIQESLITEKIKNSSTTEGFNEDKIEKEFDFDRNPHIKEIYDFLKEISLQKYLKKFIRNGYDDLSLLIEQMNIKSKNPLTDKHLIDIGIRLPGHRARILVRLEELSRNFDFEMPYGLYYNMSEEFANTTEALYDTHVKYIENWLIQMKMQCYLTNFLRGGYYCLELILMQMASRNQITEKILEEELRIDKIGYRNRILNKLKSGKI